MKGTIMNSRMIRTLALQVALTSIMAQEAAAQKAKDDNQINDWKEDRNKKKVSIKPCNKCKISFFGLTKRKYCYHCQHVVSAHLEQKKKEQENHWPAEMTRIKRRHEY